MNKKIKFLIASVSSFLAIQASVAADIEIYNGLAGSGVTSSAPTEAKPNLLFLLDTSGSMGDLAAARNERPAYDSTTNYSDLGASNSPHANYYIYDDGKVYTGMSVPSANQNCKAATDFIAANPNSPEYLDNTFIWDNVPNYTQQVTNCTSSSGTTTLRENSTSYRSTERLNDNNYPLTVVPGEPYDLTFRVRRGSYMYAEFVNSSGNRVSGGLACDWVFINSNGSRSCNSGTVPAGAVRLEVYVYRYYGGSPRWAEADLITSVQTCTTTTQTVDGNANWRGLASLLTPDSNGNQSTIEAVECETDHGIHGIDANSNEKYAQYYSSGGALGTPNYDVGIVGTTVNWSTAPQRYIVPGNYHDYLQTPFSTLVGVGSVTTLATINGKNADDSAEEYCNDGHSNWGLNETNRRDKYIQIGSNFYQCRQRIAIMKEATTDILNSMAGVNVGVMRFNYNADGNNRSNNSGGTLVSAIKDIDQGTNKQDTINAVLRLPAHGATPLQESLYEAYAYFSGKALASPNENLGRAASGSTVDDPNSLWWARSKDATDSAGKTSSNVYISPIKNHCQDNNIILFSDGEPTRDTARRTEINAFSEPNCGSSDGECLDELAGAMAANKVNASLTKMNNVYTHTIAFSQGIPILEAASDAGRKPDAALGSQYYEASDTEQLKTAFRSILLSIKKVENDSFVAPAVSVDAYSRRQNNNELYYALFEPNNRPRWKGNVKKYKINADGQILDERSTDANPIEAIDPSTGFFKEDSQSYWVDSDDPIDGAEVAKGGAARQLDISARPRKLFVNFNENDDYENKAAYKKISLLDTPEKLLGALYDNNDDGTAETDANGNLVIDAGDVDLGVIGGNTQEKSDNANKIIKWSLGQDVDLDNGNDATAPNYYLGESLHGTPYLLSFGTSANDPKNVLFATTNQGMVHAIDAEDGEELWAYIPDKDLFKNLGSYYNQVVDADHTYGLDTEISFYVERQGQNDKVSKAELFFGQRRGGKKYFAIDITDSEPSATGGFQPLVDENGSALQNAAGDPETPVKKIWTIKGGAGGTAGFEDMGETWAKPVVAKVNYCASDINNCTVTDVVFLSGGYDSAKYDNYNDVSTVSASNKAEGNDIYMVEKDTGKLLWQASKAYFPHGDDSKMNHSFPSEPALIDSDFDGVADLMFAVDISGQLWRFDFRGHFDVDSVTDKVTGVDDNGILNYTKTESTASPSVSGGIIANLNISSGNRRFYNAPAVSTIASILDADQNIVEQPKFVLSVGSGYRAHPLDTTEDTNGIYFVYDRNRVFPAVSTDSNNDPDGKISYRYGSGTTPLEVGANKDVQSLSFGDALETASGETHYHGFYYELGVNNEKIINPVFIRNGVAISTSYIPPGSISTSVTGDVCQSTTGSGNLYTTDLGTGQTSQLSLDKSGIAARPIVLKLEPTADNPSGLVVCVGTECFATEPTAPVDSSGVYVSDKVKLEADDDSLVRKINWWEERR